MDRVQLVGLMKMELRDGRTIRLCDGGFLVVGGETYTGADATFGVIGSMETFEEGVSDMVPGFGLTFLPASGAAAADISAPGMQGSRTRFSIAEADEATGLVIGAPDLMFDGQIDTTMLRVGRAKRELNIAFVSTAERLFSINEGNSLSPRFHKLVNPGELGEDNATGLGVAVAWGVDAQAAAVGTGAGGGGGSARAERVAFV